MMSSPFPTLAICLLYAYFVRRLGPRMMENRKPYDLKGVLIVYNLVQVVFSSWLFYEVFRQATRRPRPLTIVFLQSCVTGWMTTYSYRCQPVDYSTAPMAMRVRFECF